MCELNSKEQNDLPSKSSLASIIGGLLMAGAMGYSIPGYSADEAEQVEAVATAEEAVDDATAEEELVCDDSSIRLDLEEPRADVPASGVSNLRGWATSPEGIDHVELYIDGVYRFDIPYGGRRGDVGANSDHPDATYSGFSMAYNYSGLNVDESAEHAFTLRAVTPSGTCMDKEVITTVERMENSFYGSGHEMDLSEAKVAISDNQLVIRGARLDDTAYDITMGWVERSQKLGVVDIESYGLDELYHVDGIWRVEFVFNGDVGTNEEGDVVCTEGGEYSSRTEVEHEGSIVTIGSTKFYYQGNNPLFGMIFVGVQEEDLAVGGSRVTDWELNVRSDEVTGTGTWQWTDGTSECSGTTSISGVKISGIF